MLLIWFEFKKEDEELHIILQKAHKGDVWTCVFKGHAALDPLI